MLRLLSRIRRPWDFGVNLVSGLCRGLPRAAMTHLPLRELDAVRSGAARRSGQHGSGIVATSRGNVATSRAKRASERARRKPPTRHQAERQPERTNARRARNDRRQTTQQSAQRKRAPALRGNAGMGWAAPPKGTDVHAQVLTGAPVPFFQARRSAARRGPRARARSGHVPHGPRVVLGRVPRVVLGRVPRVVVSC